MNTLPVKKETHPSLPAVPNAVVPAINELINALGIPRSFLASDEEIEYAWKDLPRELSQIPAELRGELIGRMCIAVSTGLFDGAMNYIWNAAILNLRQRVRSFGLPVVAQIQKADFEERDLLELQDSQLLELCFKLNLVGEDGYFFLDQCRDTRNNFSAAHPSLGIINDREFITFLNRCVKYALAAASAPVGVDVKAFLDALISGRFNEGQLDVWVRRLSETHDAQRQLLTGMAHGIYCDPAAQEPSRRNAIDICFRLKDRFTSGTKSDLINRHSDYLAKGDTARHTASQAFFEYLGLLSLLNEAERHSIFSKAINKLWLAHQGMNNFYNEPPFAERLAEISRERVPETIQDVFVKVVVACYVGNGYGVSWAAERHYKKMIQAFSPAEIYQCLRAVREDAQFKNVVFKTTDTKKRFKDALNLFDPSSIHVSNRTLFDEVIRDMG